MTNTNNYEHKWLPTVLDRLFSSEILSTYQSGLIQNQNKYLNSVVWAHCPKRLFCSVHRCKIAVSDKVSQFNDVAQGKYYLFKILNLTVVDHTKRGLPREQRKRLNKAPTKVSAKHKWRQVPRQQRKSTKKVKLPYLEVSVPQQPQQKYHKLWWAWNIRDKQKSYWYRTFDLFIDDSCIPMVINQF